MTTTNINRTFQQYLCHTIHNERKSRMTVMTMMMVGLFNSKSVHLSHIAIHCPGDATNLSTTKRLSRFLGNRFVNVRKWYLETLKWLIQISLKTQKELVLIMDATKVGPHHQLLMVGMVFKKRTIPMVWSWVRTPKGKGHSSTWVQCALIHYLVKQVPKSARVIALGDSEFTPLQRILPDLGWFFALRQKGSHQIRSQETELWTRCDSLVNKPGEKVWLTNMIVTKKFEHHSHFLAYWKRGEKEPWLLATNLGSQIETVLAYRKRMRIEEMFGDFKGHGWDLEQSRLASFQSLSRLVLAIALIYVSIITFGSMAIKQGLRKLVDRKDRRDLSIFRIGYDLLIRYLTNGKEILIPKSLN